jgi:hypothetical protein
MSSTDLVALHHDERMKLRSVCIAPVESIATTQSSLQRQANAA